MATLFRTNSVLRTGWTLVVYSVAPYDHACAWEGVMHVPVFEG